MFTPYGHNEISIQSLFVYFRVANFLLAECDEWW